MVSLTFSITCLLFTFLVCVSSQQFQFSRSWHPGKRSSSGALVDLSQDDVDQMTSADSSITVDDQPYVPFSLQKVSAVNRSKPAFRPSWWPPRRLSFAPGQRF
ncbi:hypothetical protein RvY_19288 [Ramazzottius varieornatus]|uniref:Pro-corazonin n=1 Tax=Ramazzottius varieornatus TaxID=947166 RepID=A0A1D1W8X4_RAMVA|nr:hypothetical protein RvY_19288 [Ramazzottius varieornatus]